MWLPVGFGVISTFAVRVRVESGGDVQRGGGKGCHRAHSLTAGLVYIIVDVGGPKASSRNAVQYSLTVRHSRSPLLVAGD